ncbi:Dehydrodolichyl diphosphate synthase 2-like [Phytophthora palmivora]|uniref:Dehydrodolichyl diphosphate synthase 2-like n=1 Tax=Phytophthora palmivora TaxID=4796 RepID=A0A2P4YPQ8_9STRA|nr:Dehydrodolichyl diphosphate synthase 2-like [Phytophthora palmivora]
MPNHRTGTTRKRPKATRVCRDKPRGTSTQTQLAMATTESLPSGVRSVYLPQHIVVLVHGNNGSAFTTSPKTSRTQAWPNHRTGTTRKRPKAPRARRDKPRGTSTQTQLAMATTESLRTGVRSVYLPQHIVVLVHGNNGSAADFDAV